MLYIQLQETEENEERREEDEMYEESVPIAPMYTAVLGAKDTLKKLSKRQNSLLLNLKAYLLDERLKLQQLGVSESFTVFIVYRYIHILLFLAIRCALVNNYYRCFSCCFV